MEGAFSIASLPVLPVWLLMMLAPAWSGTRRLVTSPLVALPPALLYAALVLPELPALLPLLLRPELPLIQELLGTPRGATIAWVHFLAFDLLVGRWVYLDARARAMPAVLTSITLALVLLVGPLGWLLHLALRRITGRRGEAARDPTRGAA